VRRAGGIWFRKPHLFVFLRSELLLHAVCQAGAVLSRRRLRHALSGDVLGAVIYIKGFCFGGPVSRSQQAADELRECQSQQDRRCSRGCSDYAARFHVSLSAYLERVRYAEKTRATRIEIPNSQPVTFPAFLTVSWLFFPSLLYPTAIKTIITPSMSYVLS
jgi:hypothetical protein